MVVVIDYPSETKFILDIFKTHNIVVRQLIDFDYALTVITKDDLEISELLRLIKVNLNLVQIYIIL